MGRNTRKPKVIRVLTTRHLSSYRYRVSVNGVPLVGITRGEPVTKSEMAQIIKVIGVKGNSVWEWHSKDSNQETTITSDNMNSVQRLKQ